MAEIRSTEPTQWDDSNPQVGYQSLSLLAVFSLVLGGIFGLFVVLGSLIAFTGTTPFLLPVWAVVFPLLALITGWMALAQIRDSAGVMTGSRFAWIGINIALVTGLLYFTYYMANNLAVRQQASEFVQTYFESIAKDPPEKAFLYTITPSQRPQHSDPVRLRAFVESTYNVAQDPGQPGPFTRYQYEPYFRLLSNSGGKFEATLLKANLPDFAEGGYVVPVTYQVKTETAEMIIDLQVQSATTNRGREWFLKPVGVNTRKMDLLPEGIKQELQAKAAYGVAEKFTRALTRIKPGSFAADPDFETAFKYTVAGKAIVDAKKPDLKEALAQGVKTYFGPLDQNPGRFIPAPGDKFYSDTTIKAGLLAELTKAITPGSDFSPYVPNWIVLGSEGKLPRIVDKDGVTRFEIDVGFNFVPRTNLNGRLILETVKGAAPEDPNSWRVVNLDLQRGKIASKSPEMAR